VADAIDTIRVSVRNLVEFILREGDLDNRTGGALDKEAMKLGSQAHRKLQRRMGPSYHAEVPLAITVPYEDFEIRVEGRADGILEEDEVMVDEIKGVFFSLSRLEEPIPVHLAQAKCYAYIYASEHKLAEIRVQMTYINLDTEDIRRFNNTYSLEELSVWFQDLIGQYYRWAEFLHNWRALRNASAKDSEFPFPYRDGQKEVASSVYKTILRERKLFIQAPTGVGKTIATVFPGVKAVGEGLIDRIFYLTAKTVTRTVAEKAFQTLRDDGLRFKTITLTAKERICFQDETECNPDACPYAAGHYDRVNDAVYDLLTSRDAFSRTAIEDIARERQVCPFEMSLDLALWTDGVICDYNYVFDPNAYLRRFFSEGKKDNYLFLIDEAHNLVDRGREMYSASLRKEDFLAVRKAVGERRPKLTKKLNACNRTMLAWKRDCEGFTVLENIGGFSIQLMNLLGELEDYLEDLDYGEYRKTILDFYLPVRQFLNIFDLYDEHYVIYTTLDAGGFTLRLFCVNPAANLRQYLDKGVSSVFFSATFLPIRYYRKLLSDDPEDYAIYAKSPFDSANRLVLIGKDISSRYKLRGDDTYQHYARYIAAGMEAKRGNYMAFFSSYRMLESVMERFVELAPSDTEILAQRPDMSESEKEEFLARFEKKQDPDAKGGLIGFCVMGGIFAEGIDLTEDSLIGAFIIGAGLPMVCGEREILKDYFDERGRNGFDYAYLYAGMNRVLQAAGRVIRAEEDKGVVLLLDERFRKREYRALFPREWDEVQDCDLSDVSDKLKRFWE